MVKTTSLLALLSAAASAFGQSSSAPPAPRQPLPIAPVVAVMGQYGQYGQYQPAPAQSSAIASAVARWSAIRQSDSLPFSSYSSFLISYRGWPGEAALRRTAEARLSVESVNPRDILRYFDELPPVTAGGHAQRALALQASGRRDQALTAARAAWAAGVMPATDEQRLLGAFGSGFTSADHDARIDMLLSSGDRAGAMRLIGYASPARRQVFDARLAMQSRAPDAASRLYALGAAGSGDAGLLIDRANWMRASGDSMGARQLLAQSRRLTTRPANPERFLESLVAQARAAVNDRQWSTAYGIATLADDAFPQGADVSTRSYGERDEYTNLTWIGGQAALSMGRGADAAAMFDRYGRGAQSSQTRAKGFYWAARALPGDPRAQRWLEQAAASPDQFYGQLALERLGRTPAPPPNVEPASATERTAFSARPLAEATRYLGMVNRRADQTLFVRALAQSLRNDRERIAAAEFGRMIGRLDMGVWVAREARAIGDSFYVRPAFPEVQVPPAYRHIWAAAHGIMRQESSFDRAAVSSAGARGMMQLMPATAAIEARRLGLPFNASRLTEDPAYNVQLGSHHLSGLMDRFGNNLVLVAVAYNAGAGRVPQWIARNGDPRSPSTDVLRWIEEVPFSETRNYIQRVIENAMVYDLMDPSGGRSRGRVSYYLGQRSIR